jgi:hypothetical protein
VHGQRHSPAALLLPKNPVPVGKEVEWASQPVWKHEKYDKCTQIVANEVKLKSKLENNIEMDLKEQGCKDLGWIHLIQDRDQW